MPVQYYVLPVLICIGIWIWKRKIGLAVLAGYMLFVFSYTVLVRKVETRLEFGMVPFWSYKAIFGNGYSPVSDQQLIIQIISNIAMFIPIGVLLGRIIGWKSIVIGCAFSSLIELIQLITRRGLFEFDDIFHNTLGTVIGYWIVLIWTKLRNHREDHAQSRKKE